MPQHCVLHLEPGSSRTTSDEPGVAGSDPAQTLWTNAIPPADLGLSAMGIDEFNHLRVGQRAAPAIRDAVGDELWSKSGRSQDNQTIPLRPRPSGDKTSALVLLDASRRAAASVTSSYRQRSALIAPFS